VDVKSFNLRAKVTGKGSIEGGFLSNGPLYALLAIYMPLSFLIALLFLAGALAPMELPLAPIIISFSVSAVFASLYCDFMKDVKSSLVAADIRGAIIIAFVFYFLVSVFRLGLPFGWRFRPGIANILSAIGALYAWCSVISLKQVFSARRRFELYTELYREEQLQSVLREDISLIQYIDEKISKRRFRYAVQLVIVGILTLVSVIMKVRLALSLYFLLIGILIVGVFIFAFFEIMRREQHYAVEGIALSAADRLKHTGGIWVLILLCTVCAILAASDTSLLPFSAVASFFAWLLSLLGGLFDNKSANTFEPQSFEPLEMPPPITFPFENADASSPNWLTEYGPMILKYSLIIFAAAAFIRFMISPLLNRGKPSAEKLKFSERLWRIIAEWFKRMLTALSSFYAFLKNNKTTRKLRKYNSEEIRRTAATILNAYSQAKKQDMRRSASLFARLIIWGSDVFQVTWKPSYAPGEYCGILAVSAAVLASTSLLKEGIIRCGELFEKALYSADVLSATEQKEFKNLVEEITSITAP
jgi:hypothetical protein